MALQVRISFEQPQETIAIEVSEGIVWTLASIAVGTMRALAVKDGWASEEEIRAYVRRMIDGQLSDLMVGGDGLPGTGQAARPDHEAHDEGPRSIVAAGPSC